MSQWSIDNRPTKLDDLYGLMNVKRYFYEKAKDESWPKSILFRGQFGNGKTTSAKIVASMMVCQNPNEKGDPCGECPSCKSIVDERWDRDVILIDGGQTGKADVVDTVSEFIATPPMFDKRKVIIIEEVQELSTAAKNSLLKTLEHPKKNIHFILLSMELGGNSGFASRCVPFGFKKAPTKDIMFFLKKVLEDEGLWESTEIPQEFKMKGLATIAQTCGGSLRQALQVLDQCLVGKFFTTEDIEENMGLVDESTVIGLLLQLMDGDDSVWPGLYKYDAYEFFAVSFKIMSDALMYKTSGFLANESNSFFIQNNKKVAGHDGFDDLMDVFITLGPLSKPFLRKTEMLAHFGLYFKTRKNGTPAGVTERKVPATRNVPTRGSVPVRGA